MEIAGSNAGDDQSTQLVESADHQLSDELRGLVLLNELNCVACHEFDGAKLELPPRRAPDLIWSATHVSPQYLQNFIASPQHAEPGTAMPELLHEISPTERQQVAREITHYLVSRVPNNSKSPGHDLGSVERGRDLFHTVGCVACHSPRDGPEIESPADSSIPISALADKLGLEALTQLLEDPHAARPSGRMPNMQLSHWEALDIATYLLGDAAHVDAEHVDVDGQLELEADPGLTEKGMQHFARFRCAHCHEPERRGQVSELPPLIAERAGDGCLSGEVGSWPRFQLDERDQQALRAALAGTTTVLTHEQQITATLTALNCVACHDRGALGGVSPDRDSYFTTTDHNLGSQGRLPPTLTGVGAKLKPKWLRQVLVGGRSIRPYMTTRMPRYGTHTIEHLIDLFLESDQVTAVQTPAFDEDEREVKRTATDLVGSQGLNCVACHTFQLQPAETMSAVDLTEMGERLQADWFYHYMLHPQRFSQNTVMPTFWPGGRAIRKEAWEGDTDRQITALWQYLLDGRQARVPRGLRREPIELLSTDEAVMLRRSYRGIGKRGIGVGYPGHVNLAFDAEQFRVATLWKGKFADPGSVWRGQGSGMVRPLGEQVVEFGPGPELDDAEQPWIVDEGRPPRHQFRGYTLDRQRRPTFLYRFDSVEVEDYPVDIRDDRSGAAVLRRTVTFATELGRANTVFRVATGGTVVDEGGGSFRVDDALRIRVSAPHHADVSPAPTGQQLRIPLELPPGRTTLILEYEW